MNFCQCLTSFTKLLLLNYVAGVTNIFSHLKHIVMFMNKKSEHIMSIGYLAL